MWNTYRGCIPISHNIYTDLKDCKLLLMGQQLILPSRLEGLADNQQIIISKEVKEI